MRSGVLLFVTCLLFAAPALSKDFGVHGALFPVIEPSLLDTVKARFGEMEKTGEMDAFRDEMQGKTKDYVNRPRPVEGLLPAQVYLSYEIDLSITLDRDLMDHEGRVFAKAGTVVNPMAYSAFNKRIVMFDGDDTAQVAYALSLGNELDTLMVLTNGDPLALMRKHGRRFWFDQDAVLVKRFEIARLPSLITRADPVMRVEEIPLKNGKVSEGSYK